jgi:hypothetical protein
VKKAKEKIYVCGNRWASRPDLAGNHYLGDHQVCAEHSGTLGKNTLDLVVALYAGAGADSLVVIGAEGLTMSL